MSSKNIVTVVASVLLLCVSPAHAQEDPLSEQEIQELYQSLWAMSGHGNTNSYAFSRWYGDDTVTGTCASCHSTPGFLDFIGEDGSNVGIVDHPVPSGTTVECAVCHNPKVGDMSEVLFPSGAIIGDLGASATCVTCHQGRASAENIEAATLSVIGDDTVSEDLRFINIHYASAAVLMGGDARGGYEYPGRSYAGRFAHVEGFATCSSCHDPHSTQVRVETCTACHGAVGLSDIRLGLPDADGDGDETEGAAAEIHSLHATLGAAIMDYAANVADDPIVYAKGFPYFLNDLNADGIANENERTGDNAYVGFTPRLLRAAYNYQAVGVDPGAYAHNARYAAQLLFDSIEDLESGGVVVEGTRERP
jgi:hypothetical protein